VTESAWRLAINAEEEEAAGVGAPLKLVENGRKEGRRIPWKKRRNRNAKISEKNIERVYERRRGNWFSYREKLKERVAVIVERRSEGVMGLSE